MSVVCAVTAAGGEETKDKGLLVPLPKTPEEAVSRVVDFEFLQSF